MLVDFGGGAPIAKARTEASENFLPARLRAVLELKPLRLPHFVGQRRLAARAAWHDLIVTRSKCAENLGIPNVKTSRRGRAISRYSPVCSASSPFRRSVNVNLPPTRGSISARPISPVS